MANVDTSSVRRPVAAYVTEYEGPHGIVFRDEVVICDDGAVFTRSAGNDTWDEDVPIPGTYVTGARRRVP